MYPVALTGQRTRLREFKKDDADQALALVGDERVTAWLSFDARTRKEATAMIDGVVERAQANPRDEYYLAVTSRTGDEIIGFVRLGLSGVQAGKLGYAIHADQWGHGYATDVARTMLDFGFRELKLHRISAAVGPNNAASIAVVHHLGFRCEGCLRDHVYTNGAWRDSLLYSVLTHEWALTAQDSPHSSSQQG